MVVLIIAGKLYWPLNIYCSFLQIVIVDFIF